MANINLQVATPESIVFDGECSDILVQAERGELNILPQHARLVSFLRPGLLRVRQSGKELAQFQIEEGILKVENDRVKVLAPVVTSPQS